MPEEPETPKPVRRRGVERSLEIQLGRLGGVDLRPTRLFLWGGEERKSERIVSLGRAPRNLLVPRREREVQAGAVHVRSLGNPLMTVALAGVHAARRLREQRELSERESADPGSTRSLPPPD